jgi:hypothetical protein
MTATLDNPVWHALTGSREWPLLGARAAIERGEIPLLHVFPSNPSIRWSQQISFCDRTTLLIA